MKIALFGATGPTGRLVVQKALARGHELVALVRNPDALPEELRVNSPNIVVRKGSPLSPNDVRRCVRDADAVIHCLGIGGKGDGRPTTLVSDSVRVVLDAMDESGVSRIVCMSNIGAGDSGSWLANRIVIPLFLRWLRPIIADKDRMEAALRHSGVEWVSVRLPRIVDGPERPLRTSADGRGLSFGVTTRSVAGFLLDQVERADFVRSAPSISN